MVAQCKEWGTTAQSLREQILRGTTNFTEQWPRAQHMTATTCWCEGINMEKADKLLHQRSCSLKGKKRCVPRNTAQHEWVPNQGDRQKCCVRVEGKERQLQPGEPRPVCGWAGALSCQRSRGNVHQSLTVKGLDFQTVPTGDTLDAWAGEYGGQSWVLGGLIWSWVFLISKKWDGSIPMAWKGSSNEDSSPKKNEENTRDQVHSQGWVLKFWFSEYLFNVSIFLKDRCIHPWPSNQPLDILTAEVHG